MSRKLVLACAAVATVGLLASCTSNSTDNGSGGNGDGGATPGAVSSNDDPGESVVIGFSGPAAGHGWMGAINRFATETGEQYSDVELRVAEGTDDPSTQISHIETFINDRVDAIVLLPTDGAALTEIAIQAMEPASR